MFKAALMLLLISWHSASVIALYRRGIGLLHTMSPVPYKFANSQTSPSHLIQNSENAYLPDC